MAKSLMMLFVTFFCIATAQSAQISGSWEKKEMDPRVGNRDVDVIDRISKIDNVSLLPPASRVPSDLRCDTSPPQCIFDLHYFKGETFKLSDPNRKNILVVAGGPGEFVREKTHMNAALAALDGQTSHALAGRHNIVYFHVRGAGQSDIRRNNSFDQFLRAKYVVEDIETLRQEVLGGRPWDAIYAHSWGTIVAQLYAKKFGTSNSTSGHTEPGVNRLILSAPVVRKHSQTLEARTKQTIINLRKMYQFFRPQGTCTISDESYLKHRVTDFDIETAPEDLDRTDNLCFISDSQISSILRDVEKVLRDLEPDYGSVDFINDKDNFNILQHDSNFPKHLKKYPLEFFAAIRRVQMLGAPEDNALVFTVDVKSMVNAALIIGYNLSPQISRNLQAPCDPSGKFFTGAAASPGIKTKYCDRLVKAKDQLLESNDGLNSERARYVFGAYDGAARWVFRLLDKDCFTGEDLRKFANAALGRTDRKKPVRDAAKKIGIDTSGDSFCGWDPGGSNAHAVPTLILAGSADAIIAGCQAEDFYNDGLTGHRVFLEFPGMGHTMTVANARILAKPLPETEKFADLIAKFVEMAPSQLDNFLANAQSELTALKVKRQAVGLQIPCP